MVQYARCDSPFGPLVIGCELDAVTFIRLSDGTDFRNCPSPLSELAAAQLREYFEGTRKQFDFSINPEGTAFQRLVWHALMQIPYGETRSYGQIAAMIGKPKATRAVGAACNRNPIWLAIPCHRVLGTDKSLTGYAGGLAMKQALLELEMTHK